MSTLLILGIQGAADAEAGLVEDVGVDLGGGDVGGEGFKAVEEVQPGRSRGGPIEWGCRWLEHGDKIAVQKNSSRKMLRNFSERGG